MLATWVVPVAVLATWAVLAVLVAVLVIRVPVVVLAVLVVLATWVVPVAVLATWAVLVVLVIRAPVVVLVARVLVGSCRRLRMVRASQDLATVVPVAVSPALATVAVTWVLVLVT